jgi:hypothetical protein
MARKSKKGDGQSPGQLTKEQELSKAERTATNMEDIFGKDQQVDNTKHIDEILGKVLIITGFKRLTGETGEYFFIYAFEPGQYEEFGFTCGGGVVREKLDKVHQLGKFPLKCVIKSVKPRRGGRDYYDILPG